MNPVEGQLGKSTINYGVEYNDKDPKFKVGDHVRISKQKKFV